MPKLGLGLSLATPAVPSAAAPSGIEVATTASVIVAGFTGDNTTYNGTYTKGTSGGADPRITTPPTDGEVYIKGLESFVLLPPSVTIGGNNSYDGDEYPYSFEPQGNWTISRMSDDGEGATSLLVIATNPSSNNDYIPETGWSPSITITAAPSGIPVASTNTIIMSGSGPTYIQTFGSGNADGSYIKQSETFYDLDGTRYLYYWSGGNCWVATWSNGDNSYDWASSPQSSASFIPTNWGNGLTITAA